MTDQHDSTDASTPRERELELEVARLQAEVDALKGEDPATATSRFLAMAAETVDKAVADARREADEIVEEISGEAEARRDEATRVAAEAEAMAEMLLADADRAQEAVEKATEEAATIKATAEVEAAEIVATEREKVAAEYEAVAEVRTALDEERAALDSYHESLRRRVQELAESMVSFMDNELPAASAGALEGAVSPRLEEHDDHDEDPTDETSESSESTDPLDTPAPAVASSGADSLDPWVEMLESAIPEEDRIVDMPDTAIDEIPPGPPAMFGDAPVIEEEADDESSSSLFSRARSDDDEVIGFDDLAADDDDDSEEAEPEEQKSGLFGMLGARLVEQTPPDDLAEALDTDDSEDQAFRQFLDGDDAPDPSRDWLLRPEQS